MLLFYSILPWENMPIIPHYNVNIKKLKKYLNPKKFHWEKRHVKLVGKTILWFSLGGILGLLFFISFLYMAYKNMHEGRVYDGVFVSGVNFSGQKPEAIAQYFNEKNKTIQRMKITLHSDQVTATISAKQIGFEYDANLLATQAMTIGRSNTNSLTNMSILLQAYTNTLNLPPAYHYSEQKLDKLIAPLAQQINVASVEPLFNFQDGRVTAFQIGQDGKSLDEEALKNEIIEKLKMSAFSNTPQALAVAIPVKITHTDNATDVANKLGIKEEVSEGTSHFAGSTDDRIYNISLAASRLNGVIIKPGEIFSFDQTVGDISSLTGYKQAYVIENGKTTLGDGGGVCQVSTTMFRAALNAGLPIVERHQHAYRVGYYEQDSGPGIDAAIYTPTVDLKFKNDTGNAILIQTELDTADGSLTFALYGTKDGRQVSISTPVVTSTTPAPPAQYQDDPTLPSGQVKQVDFSANGADVYFTRTVTKNGKVLYYDKFTSDYQPWQAIYLRGTKT
jgi:vancomycin resistance protein YoaR